MALLTMLAVQSPAKGPADPPADRNLKVLPHDISRSDLGDVMLENLHGLGLPRLGGEGCLSCHEGSLEVPRSEWDFASDAKPMKEKARTMMAMVQAINDDFLAQLEPRSAPALRVTCMTCHAGRTDPRPLPDVLRAAYDDGGVDAASARYRDLRERYFGADAYDFRVHVLPGVATELADDGKIDDAIALAALNVEVHEDDVFAKQAWLRLVLERLVDRDGVESAVAELVRLEPTLAPGVAEPGLLDALSWRLIRSERRPQGHALIAANYERFPERYRAVESMVFVLADTERRGEAIAMLERWLETHPDHDRARRLLINLRAEKG